MTGSAPTAAIRLAGPGDAGEVAALLGEFRDWWGYGEPSDADLRASVGRLLGDPATDFLLGAPAAGEPPAGVCQLRYRLSVWTGAPDCYVEDLFVRSAARGTGLGRAMLDAALDRARERGCVRVELDVGEGNPAALALYESAGFALGSERTGERNLLARLRLR